MERYRIEVTGRTPLLMHYDNLHGQDWLDRWRKIPENKKASKAGDDRTPPETWKFYVYNDDVHVVIPDDCLRSCLMSAGKQSPSGKGKGTLKTDAVQGIIYDDMFFPLMVGGTAIKWADIQAISGSFSDHCELVKMLGFELFAKRASVGQNKHIRVRPKFKNWSFVATITTTSDALDRENLETLLRVAGTRVGLCDWRPGAKQSPGPYGQFDAKLTKL